MELFLLSKAVLIRYLSIHFNFLLWSFFWDPPISAHVGLVLHINRLSLTRYDLWTSDECFLTGTAAEVIPCVEVDHRPVGNGQPGDMTRKFIASFREKAKVDGIKI